MSTDTITTPANLQCHYDRKYADETPPRRTIPLVRWPRNRYQAAVKCATAGERALDIGAGRGDIITTLRTNYQQWVATELSQPRADALAQTFAHDEDVQVLQHNLETQPLPFAADTFDAVFLIAIVEHLIDPITALQELHRVLSPAGRLIIATPNIAKWTRRLKLLCGRFPATASTDEGLTTYARNPTDLHDEGHLHYFTYRSLTRMLTERVGFNKIERHPYGRLGPLTQAVPTLFADIMLVAHK